MQRTVLIGMLTAAGAFAGVIAIGSRTEAADEIRCRVNVEALVQDIVALEKAQKKIDKDFIKDLLNPKP